MDLEVAAWGGGVGPAVGLGAVGRVCIADLPGAHMLAPKVSDSNLGSAGRVTTSQPWSPALGPVCSEP